MDAYIKYYCADGVRARPLTPSAEKQIQDLHRREQDNIEPYVNDLRNVLAETNFIRASIRPPMRALDLRDFPFALGDMRTALNSPVVAKCRPVHGVKSRNHVILPLNFDRHWTRPLREVEAHDMPWFSKEDAVVWRGASTGPWSRDRGRLALVSRWAGELNVGVSLFVQGVPRDPRIEAPHMSIADQLRSRYILSVEGNDVATNLVWAMASRSLVLMPKPRHETWLMEGRLRDGVHYVRVRDDFADLQERLAWCRANPRACTRISRNATQWVQRVRQATDAVAPRVLHRFTEHIR